MGGRDGLRGKWRALRGETDIQYRMHGVDLLGIWEGI